MRRVIAYCTGSAILVAVVFAPGFPWLARSPRIVNRLVAKAGTAIARWRGQQPRLISLTGRLIRHRAQIDPLRGGRVIAAESTSGYCAMSDREGRFVIPHLMWYPNASYNLIISADERYVKRIKLTVPSSYPVGNVVDVGEVRVDDEFYEIDQDDSLVRPMEYDSNGREYYAAVFDRLSAELETDERTVDAISKYVAGKYHCDEPAGEFKSPRQILERGSCYCSDLALAMAAITAAGNYPTRTIHLSDSPEHHNTHVVVEVYYGDQWHLYDPTYGVFFLNRQREVASYKELRLDASLVTRSAFEGLKAETAESILAWMPKAYRAGFHQIYQVNKREICHEP